jgi:hypothetical protein
LRWRGLDRGRECQGDGMERPEENSKWCRDLGINSSVVLAIWLKVWIESFNERLHYNVFKENNDVKIN